MKPPAPEDSPLILTTAAAGRLAALALNGLTREYPNKLDHVMGGPGEIKSPRELHPAFYGSFDWHSSVHGHWMLIRLLRRHPGLPDAGGIRRALQTTLTPQNLEAETRYLQEPGRENFERTYGWAWLLKLAAELHGWHDPDGISWSSALSPLAAAIESRYLDFLPRQTYPIRSGVHANTAFGLAFACDYARTCGRRELESQLQARACDYFAADRNYPAAWEPGGEDFLSAALMEADLMRRIMPPDAFAGWFHGFLPELPPALRTPATVTSRTDPKTVHLDGLNLSRAACLWNIAQALPGDPSTAAALRDAAERHARASLPHVASGDYAGEHWLASFALWMLNAREG